MRFLLLLLGLSVCTSPSFAETPANAVLFPDLKVGKEAYKQKDYAKAHANWLPLAEAGFPKAKTELGKLYLRGLGVPQNPKMAYALFKSAFENGDPRGLIEIGRLYEKGIGAPVNILLAKNWYERASMAGYARGDYMIGELYQKKKLSPYYGAPTPQSSQDFIKDSLKNFKKKKFEHAEAMADMYRLGLHVMPDYEKALVLMLVAEMDGSKTAARKARILETKVDYDAFIETKKTARNMYTGRAKTVIEEYKEIKNPEETFYQKAEREAEAAYYFQKAADNGYKRAAKRLAELEAEKTSNGEEKTQLASLEIPEKKKYKIKGTLKTQYSFEDNLDLGTRGLEHEDAAVADAVVGVHLYPTDNITAYVQGRAFLSRGNASSNTDDDDDEVDQDFFEMRQAWIEFDEVFHPLLSVKVGRQRFKEPRTIFWNRDLDAVRLSLDSTRTKGFIAIGENQSSYRTGSDNELEGDEEDRLRILAEASHLLTPDHEISARFLYEDDHSGLLANGSIVDDQSRDDEDANLLWAGIRSEGTVETKEHKAVKSFFYRADFMSVFGEEDVQTSTSGPRAGQRTITGNQNRDVFGVAFDGSVGLAFDNIFEPTVTLGYAYGSGDDGTNPNGTNNAFRQTDLHGNNSRFPYGFTNESTRNYGEVLRPELSNIHILQAGVHLPIFEHSDMSVNYYRYWLAEKEAGLRSSSISAALNGTDRDIGQELNASANIYLGKELNLTSPLAQQTTFRLRFGAFNPGGAYNVDDGEIAYRGTGEFRFRF